MYKKIISQVYSKDISFDPGFYIIATPIGNRYDITIRAIKVLEISDTLVCEDTRITKNLFKLLNISTRDKKWISYNDYATKCKREIILNELKKNKIVCLISDAGTPLISDPGYKLINYIKNNGYKIKSIPGACSAIASLVISGLKTDKFCFLGFLPKNKNNYLATLKRFSNLNTSLILYEKANRINFFLKILKDNFLSFKLVIVRELTKIHEEVIYIDEKKIDLFIEKRFNLKGEITAVLEIKNNNNITYTDKELQMELKNMKPSQVSSMLAKTSDQSRNAIYKRCIRILHAQNIKK